MTGQFLSNTINNRDTYHGDGDGDSGDSSKDDGGGAGNITYIDFMSKFIYLSDNEFTPSRTIPNVWHTIYMSIVSIDEWRNAPFCAILSYYETSKFVMQLIKFYSVSEYLADKKSQTFGCRRCMIL